MGWGLKSTSSECHVTFSISEPGILYISIYFLVDFHSGIGFCLSCNVYLQALVEQLLILCTWACPIHPPIYHHSQAFPLFYSEPCSLWENPVQHISKCGYHLQCMVFCNPSICTGQISMTWHYLLTARCAQYQWYWRFLYTFSCSWLGPHDLLLFQ